MSISSSLDVMTSDNDWLNSPSPSGKVIFSRPTAKRILSKISNSLIKNNRKEKVCFCVEKELPVSSIDVTVKNIGKLQFPLYEDLIKKLINNSAEAKFRKNDQVLLDKMVCDTNKIEANKLNVTINNNLFEEMLHEMGQELGLPETTSLKPNLCNMLICNPGQCFEHHQNVKQTDGIIATLIIILPVEHVGGDIIIKHNKERHEFYSEDVNTDNFKCAAFYSECYYRAMNITRGYQIALTYNIISLPKVACYSHYSNLELETLMKKYFSDEMVNKVDDLHLIYFLDHSYTEHNLKWNMLKGIDIKNGSAMYNAAQILNLVPHLVLIEMKDDEYNEESYELEDMKVNFWIDSSNKQVPYSKLTSEFICCTTENKNFEPLINDVRYEEDIVRRYVRAAIVLWPVSNDIRMKFILNYTKEKKEFFEMLKIPSKKEIIMQIILNAREHLHDMQSLGQKDYLVFLVDIAIKVDDDKVALELLSYFLWEILDLDVATCFVKLESKYMISFVIELLQKWWENMRMCLLGNIFNIVTNLVRLNVSIELIEFILEKEYNSLTKNLYSKSDHIKELLKACELVKDSHAGTIQNSLVDKFLTNRRYDLAAYIIPLISDLKENDVFIGTPWFRRLENYAISEITKKMQQFYKLSNDWSVPCSIWCKCNYCLILNQFFLSEYKTKKILSCRDTNTYRHIRRNLKYLPRNSIRITTDGKSPKCKIIFLKMEELHHRFKNEYNKYKSYLFDLAGQ